MKKLYSSLLAAALVATSTVAAGAAPLRKVSASPQQRTSSVVAQRVQDTHQVALKGQKMMPRLSAQKKSPLAQRTPLHKRSGKVQFRAPLRAPESFPQINGVVIYSESWGGESQMGMYSIPMNAESSLELLGPGVECSGSCAVVDGIFYTNYAESFWGMTFGVAMFGYDTEDWSQVYEGNYVDALNTYYDTGVDPKTGNVYGIVADETGAIPMWAILDYPNGTVQYIAEAPSLLLGLGFTADGQAYGVDSEANFVKIDKLTGESTVLSSLSEQGFTPAYVSSGTIDAKSGRFFFNCCGDDEEGNPVGHMLEIDPATGQVVYSYPLEGNEEILGLYVPQPAAEDGAPAAVTNLSLKFEGASLSGTVGFQTPNTTFDGSPITGMGMLTYHILANGEEIASGTQFAGIPKYQKVELQEPGNYTFTIYCSNEVGDGPKAKISRYIGNDTPMLTAGTAKYENGQFVVEWQPAQGFNNGYIDTENLTYTVFMYSSQAEDPEIVASDTKETSVTVPYESPEELTSFYFTIRAEANGLSSEMLKTNKVVLGEIIPPYSEDFEEEGALDYFTVIDGNGDEIVWTLDSGMAWMRYNASSDMDDWLITAPIKLEAGKAYLVSFKAYSQGTNYPERVEAMWGRDASAAGMTNVLVEPTTILTLTKNPEDAANLSGYMTPEADGLYYVGIHGISDADQYYLYVDDFSVEAGIDLRAPNAAQIDPVADPEGALRVEVKVTAPTLDFGNNELTEPMSVKLLRNGEFAGEQENVAPGAEIVMVDEPTSGGETTYTVVCENSYGEGKPASAKVFVGINAPGLAQNINIVETEEGCVKLTWDPITEDVLTLPLNPAKVKYYVLDMDANIVGDVSECEWEGRVIPEGGEQDFVYMGIMGYTDGGEGDIAVSNMIPVGAPTPAPYFESGALENIIGVSNAGGGSWGIMNDSQFADITSADSDDAFFACQGTSVGAYADLFTGKIAVGELADPALSFYTYNIEADAPDENELIVSVICDGVETQLKDVVMSELPLGEWSKVVISLADYSNKVVQINFRAVTNVYSYTFLDAIRVFAQVDNNLSAGKLTAPAKVKSGEAFNIGFNVINNGLKAATDYTVNLYCNDELVASKPGVAIEPNASSTFTFEQTLSPVAPATNVYHAEIVFAADEDQTDNTSADATVILKISTLPTVVDFNGESTENGNVLTWNEPDLTANVPETVTENFEEVDDWADCPEGWTIYDLDGAIVGGINGVSIPGWVTGTDKSTWKVLNGSELDTSADLLGHDGSDKYIASMFNYSGEQNDEWLVSPELFGGAQTISFYARNFGGYQEVIRIWYSTGSLEPADFIEIEAARVDNVAADWTEYTADLPEGAKHFAINCFSKDAFMLMIDDITYTKSGETAGLSISGYNIYRDGKLFATVEETTFTDADCYGQHSYAVTVVYNRGEGAPSNIITLDNTMVGIDALINSGLRGDVYNLQGIRLMNNVGARDVRDLPAGIYIFAGRKVQVK